MTNEQKQLLTAKWIPVVKAVLIAVLKIWSRWKDGAFKGGKINSDFIKEVSTVIVETIEASESKKHGK